MSYSIFLSELLTEDVIFYYYMALYISPLCYEDLYLEYTDWLDENNITYNIDMDELVFDNEEDAFLFKMRFM